MAERDHVLLFICLSKSNQNEKIHYCFITVYRFVIHVHFMWQICGWTEDQPAHQKNARDRTLDTQQILRREWE